MEKYQTFFPRLVALLIDGFIMLPIAILDDWFRKAEFPLVFFYIWIPVSSLVVPVYTILMNGFYGQTLGKMAMNVMILDISEEPINFKQAILRELPQLFFNVGAIFLGIIYFAQDPESMPVKSTYGVYMTAATVWGFADIITFFANEKRRALHDFIAKTVVVKTNLPN